MMQRNRSAHTTCFVPWRRVNVKKTTKVTVRGCCHNDNPFVSSIFNATEEVRLKPTAVFFPSVNVTVF